MHPDYATRFATASTGKPALFISRMLDRIAREEINIGAAGANYGWRKFEGTHLNFPNDPAIPQITRRLSSNITMSATSAGVIGGYVYRGAAIEGLQGTYFFADLATDKVTSFRFTDGGGVTELTDRTAELISPTGISGSITSFGEDGFGNIYLVSFDGGKVGMITAIPEPEGLGHDAGGHGPGFSMGAASRASSCVGSAAIFTARLPDYAGANCSRHDRQNLPATAGVSN